MRTTGDATTISPNLSMGHILHQQRLQHVQMIARQLQARQLKRWHRTPLAGWGPIAARLVNGRAATSAFRL